MSGRYAPTWRYYPTDDESDDDSGTEMDTRIEYMEEQDTRRQAEVPPVGTRRGLWS